MFRERWGEWAESPGGRRAVTGLQAAGCALALLLGAVLFFGPRPRGGGISLGGGGGQALGGGNGASPDGPDGAGGGSGSAEEHRERVRALRLAKLESTGAAGGAYAQAMAEAMGKAKEID